jgi:uncharacterized protein
MLSDAQLADLLTNAHTIAVYGLSDEPDSPSFEVAAYQQSQGYKLIPVTDDDTSILGRKTVKSLDEVTEPVDIVNVFTRGEQIPPVADAAKALGAKAIWLQPGTSPVVENAMRDSGLTVVSNRCFKKEHQRLLARAQM